MSLSQPTLIMLLLRIGRLIFFNLSYASAEHWSLEPMPADPGKMIHRKILRCQMIYVYKRNALMTLIILLVPSLIKMLITAEFALLLRTFKMYPLILILTSLILMALKFLSQRKEICLFLTIPLEPIIPIKNSFDILDS